jgi:hypothetical protein
MQLEVEWTALATGASSAGGPALEKPQLSLHAGQHSRPGPAALRYSVVVTTAGDPKKLGECLRALFLQNIHRSEFEILVVDLHPATAAFDVFDVCQTSSGGQPRMRYIAARAKTLAQARALGRREAHSPAVIQISDDVLPVRSWLQCLAASGAARPQPMAIPGVEGPQGRSAWLALVAGGLLVLGGAIGFAAAAFAHSSEHRAPALPLPAVGAARWVRVA